MKALRLTVITPDGILFDGQAVKLCLRGADGDLAVLAGHTPFTTYIQPGNFRIETDSGKIFSGKTEGGIISVAGDQVKLISGDIRSDVCA